MPKFSKSYEGLCGGAASRVARARDWRDAHYMQGTGEMAQALLRHCPAFRIGAKVRTTLNQGGMVCEVKDYADREVELLPQQVEMVDDEGELVGAVSFARSAQLTS